MAGGGGGGEGVSRHLEDVIDVAEQGGGAQVVRADELNPSCSICLFEYYFGEDVTLLPCGHLYHTEVIKPRARGVEGGVGGGGKGREE